MSNVVLRPKEKAKKPNSKPFRGFNLSDKTDAQIDALASKYGISRSELVREVIDQVYSGEFAKGFV